MKTFKFFKRGLDGVPYEVPNMDGEVEYWEETETLTRAEFEAKYPIRIWPSVTPNH